VLSFTISRTATHARVAAKRFAPNGDWEDFMKWSQEKRNHELERGAVVQIRSKIPTQLPRAA
jgi:hypothetical protein